MRIIMFTNTYPPHVGGVARSVHTQTQWLREHGHRVMVIAPEFEDMPEHEIDTIRVPAIQNFNGSDFSVQLPLGVDIHSIIKKFKPEIIHSHHPFLLGTSALRHAKQEGFPLIFTYHTRYEEYAHYIMEHADSLKHIARELSIIYAEMADAVIVPSESIARLVIEAGVEKQPSISPTGINPTRFKPSQHNTIREQHGIPSEAPLLGHVGRLAPEKNLCYLMKAVSLVLQRDPQAYFIVVGYGPQKDQMTQLADERGVLDRCVFTGKLEGQDLADAYHAMNLFVFSSKSETQGMVLAEAMTCGKPVIALDAPGAREVVEDHVNGRLLNDNASPEEFAKAIESLRSQSAGDRRMMAKAITQTAARFTIEACMRKQLEIYQAALDNTVTQKDLSVWDKFLLRCETEWQLLKNKWAIATHQDRRS